MSSPDAGVPVCYRHPDREAHIRCQRCGRPICPDCMREASVGFQCPECVSEGRKHTRAGQGPYGGGQSARPQLTSYVLVGINAVVWLVITLTGGAASTLARWLELRPLGSCVEGSGYYPNATEAICGQISTAQWVPGVADGAWWQLISSGFVHVSVIHLAFNCFFIAVIGPQLEMFTGRLRFLAIYFASLIGGSVLVYWAASEFSSTLGASGAAYGMMAALLIVMLRRGLDVRQLVILIVVNTGLTLVVSGISWQGHLGGFLGGAIAAAVIVYAPRGPARSRVQLLGLIAVLLVAAGLVVARTAMLV